MYTVVKSGDKQGHPAQLVSFLDLINKNWFLSFILGTNLRKNFVLLFFFLVYAILNFKEFILIIKVCFYFGYSYDME